MDCKHADYSAEQCEIPLQLPEMFVTCRGTVTHIATTLPMSCTLTVWKRNIQYTGTKIFCLYNMLII